MNLQERAKTNADLHRLGTDTESAQTNAHLHGLAENKWEFELARRLNAELGSYKHIRARAYSNKPCGTASHLHGAAKNPPFSLLGAQMSDFGSYTGSEFLNLQLEDRKFLVDQILREKDSVMLVGGEKAGKSLLIKQLICSLTTGDHPFLDNYEVKRACKVTYVLGEGELSDTQSRFKKMIKALDFEPANFQLIFSGPLELEQDEMCTALIKTICSVHVPDVLIFDPLYFCFNGSLSDDAVVRKFLGNIRKIKEILGCAVIIVHHTHKMRFNQDGTLLNEGDDALFGSSALKWWPDHLLFFTYDRKRNVRHFRCSTQRSGDILDKLELVLEQPDPLYFRNQEVTDTAMGMNILRALEKRPMSCNDICGRINISRSTFYRDIKPLLKSGHIQKDEAHRPILYKVQN